MLFKPSDHPELDRRVNESILASSERALLDAITVRLPDWVTPNQLTRMGLVGAAVVMLGYALSNSDLNWLWLANFGLLIHWFGDSLDGSLARYRVIERPRFGFYLDQVTDAIGSLMISVGVGLCPLVRMDLALLVLAVYLMLTLQGCIRAIVDREFHIAVGRLGPTELRLGIVGMNLGIWMFGVGQVPWADFVFSWLDLLMILTAAGMLLLMLHQMRRHLVRLSAEDPPRHSR